MDKQLIHTKIDSIIRCLNRVSSKLPASSAALLDDLDAQDVITLNITRAVQLCVDIAMHMLAQTNQPTPITMGESFEGLTQMGVIDSKLAIQMKAAVGFRNIAVHSYDDVNIDITFAIGQHHLQDFKAYLKAIDDWLRTH